jgi:hypothetical protein
MAKFSHHCMTAFWSVAWRKHPPLAAASSSPTQRKRQAAGRRLSFLPVKAAPMMRARLSLWPSTKDDRILFGKYSGTEIKIDGEEYIIMKEDEVLGILTGAAQPQQQQERTRRLEEIVTGSLVVGRQSLSSKTELRFLTPHSTSD